MPIEPAPRHSLVRAFSSRGGLGWSNKRITNLQVALLYDVAPLGSAKVDPIWLGRSIWHVVSLGSKRAARICQMASALGMGERDLGYTT